MLSDATASSWREQMCWRIASCVTLQLVCWWHIHFLWERWFKRVSNWTELNTVLSVRTAQVQWEAAVEHCRRFFSHHSAIGMRTWHHACHWATDRFSPWPRSTVQSSRLSQNLSAEKQRPAAPDHRLEHWRFSSYKQVQFLENTGNEVWKSWKVEGAWHNVTNTSCLLSFWKTAMDNILFLFFKMLFERLVSLPGQWDLQVG